MRPAVLLLNPAAGRGRAGRRARAIVAALTAQGFACDVRASDRPGGERALAYDAARGGCTTLLVAGGDGTVHGAANGLLAAARPNVALGVIPAGTGNDFAKMAGLAVGPAEAARRLARAVVRRFDVGRVGDERFTNGCGVGFGPAVLTAMAAWPRLRGFPLYVAATYRTFFRYRPVTMRVAAEEWSGEEPMMLAEVAIGTTAGGGFRLTPQARPDDGWLDVCLIGNVGTGQFLRYVPRVMAGRHAGLPPVRLFRTRAVRLAVPGGPLVLHMDGELRTLPGDTMDVTIEPGRLAVLCAS